MIVQNVGVGLFSVLLGRIGDRYGNRLALRVATATCAATPVVAVGIASGALPGGRALFWATFFLLGMQPVTFKTFANYVLELAAPADHPRYLGTLTVCLAAPLPLSLPLGWLVGRAGHAPAFLLVAATIAGGCVSTWFLAEPRRRA